VLLDGRGAAPVIGPDYLAQILRVELCRERSRPDQIAEHDGELTPFGDSGDDRRSGPSWLKFPDRSQQFAAIAQDNPEFLQVFIGEIAQD
jgi:hypothetical protein